MLIDIAGFEVQGRWQPGTPRLGAFLEPKGLTGWTDGVDMRMERIARPSGAGSYPAKARPDSRVISVSGNVLTRSEAETEDVGNRITGVLAAGDMGRMFVRRESGFQYADVQLADRTKFEVRGEDPTLAAFQFQVWAPDPLKYGATTDFVSDGGQLVEVFHRGNYPARPVCTITGSGPGYTIAGDGNRRFEVRLPVEVGVPHTVDLGTGQVTVGGRVRYGVVGQADTWPIPPRRKYQMRLIPTGGSLQMRTRVKDSYL